MSGTVKGVSFGTKPPKPASGRRGRGPTKEWVAVAEELRANPGKWGKIEYDGELTPSKASGLATRINKGKSSVFQPEGHFKAEVLGENRDEVWAVYYGPEETSGEAAVDVPDDEPVDDTEDDSADSDADEQGVVRF